MLYRGMRVYTNMISITIFLIVTEYSSMYALILLQPTLAMSKKNSDPLKQVETINNFVLATRTCWRELVELLL